MSLRNENFHKKEPDILQQIAIASDAIRRKHKLIKLGKETVEQTLNNTFKLIFSSLEKIIDVLKIRKTVNSVEEVQSEDKENIYDDDDDDDEDNDSDVTFMSATDERVDSNNLELLNVNDTKNNTKTRNAHKNHHKAANDVRDNKSFEYKHFIARNIDRRSKRQDISGRGPPGIGFKVTNSGNFDLDGKRLCNVARAEELNDAVNLQLVLDLIKKETDTIHNVIASLRTEIFNKNIIIDVLKSTVNQKLKNIQIDHKSTEL